MAVLTGAYIERRLVRQVTSPVRWDLCLDTWRDLGVSTAIDLPPGGTLTGITRGALPRVEPLAVKTPDNLASARAAEVGALIRPAEPTSNSEGVA